MSEDNEPPTDTAEAGEEDAPVKEEESTATFEPVVRFGAYIMAVWMAAAPRTSGCRPCTRCVSTLTPQLLFASQVKLEEVEVKSGEEEEVSHLA